MTTTHERDRTTMDMDEYQSLAASTAVYPRVYTEGQVKNMLTRFGVREFGDYYDVLAWLSTTEGQSTLDSYLDEFETPFSRLVYPVLGLVGEAGEIANKLKKVARDNQGEMAEVVSDDLAKEIGDTLWYVAAVAKELNVKLGVVANANIDKLYDRKQRGVLGGDGDNR